jgi:hypothetical protein
MKTDESGDAIMVDNPHAILADSWKKLVRAAALAGSRGKLFVMGLELLFIAAPFIVFLISLFLFLLFWPALGFISIILATVFVIILVIMIVGMSSFPFGANFPSLMLFAFVGSAVALTLSLSSFTSYALASFYLQHKGELLYKTQEMEHWAAYVWLYLWHLIDMIPVIEVWEHLPLQDPPKPLTLIGGLPILGFRIVILLPIIQLLRRYMATRKQSSMS